MLDVASVLELPSTVNNRAQTRGGLKRMEAIFSLSHEKSRKVVQGWHGPELLLFVSSTVNGLHSMFTSLPR